MSEVKLEPGVNSSTVPKHDGTYNPIYNDPAFPKALSNFPIGEIEIIEKTIETSLGHKLGSDELNEYIRSMVATRFTNPICHNCHKKPPKVVLLRCSACALVWYCNRDCQRANWNIHKNHCCKPEAPVDPNCPYRLAVIPFKIPEGVDIKAGQVLDIR